MRLLLTRAPEDSARTRERLEADGHQVLVSPVIEVAATGARWPAGAVDAVLATSAQTFVVADGLGGPLPEARRLMPLLLVGQRTEDAARAAGFSGATQVAATAAALATVIEALEHRPRRIVYLAGRQRKPEIETALDEMGQTYKLLEVYEARPIAKMEGAVAAALGARTVDAVLHFSRRSASIFLAQAREADVDAGAARHLCLSEDVAEPLRAAALPRIEIARAPRVGSLIQLIDLA